MDRVDQITTFVRVVELGGFAAAARDLGAAPSAVTTHIQALEQRLGARLLNRNTRHVKPTEVGEAYYKHCLDILSRLEEAESLVASMQAKPRGVLRLNTSCWPLA
jgi:DNA-binding transcriptional LysR family regulator